MAERLYERGMDWGVGIDLVSNQVRGWGVDVKQEAQPVKGATGGRFPFSLRLVKSHRELRQALHVSASASVGFAIVSGGAETKFVEEHAFDRYSVYLLVQSWVEHAHERMRDVELKSEATEVLKNQGPGAFRERFGDEFVVGITGGGHFVGLIRVSTTSDYGRSQLLVGAEASGLFGAISADGAYARKVSSFFSGYEKEVWSMQVGGNDPTPTMEFDKMLEKAIGFAQSVGESKVPIWVETLDYGALPLPPDTRPINVNDQLYLIRILSDYRSELLDKLASVTYVLAHPEQFGTRDIGALNMYVTQLQGLINDVHEAVKVCTNDYQQCKLLPDMAVPQINLPNRKLTQEERARQKF